MMRFVRLLDAPASRFTLAVIVVVLARSALRQPYVFPAESATARAAPSAPAHPRPAPTVRVLTVPPANYPIEHVWNQMYVVYGDRLAQAALRNNRADYLATWQEMGSYLRAHHVTTRAFKDRMTKLGWPADEQERLLVAAGYTWPPRMSGEPPAAEATP